MFANFSLAANGKTVNYALILEQFIIERGELLPLIREDTFLYFGQNVKIACYWSVG